MKYKDCVFLSAGIPDPLRGPEFAKTADPIAIAAAVAGLLHVTLGRRPLVWGGHPAITPMVWAIADSLDVDYGAWVKLYQTTFFKDDFPEDNNRFKNVVYTDAITGDRDSSLRVMRERMLSENHFHCAVFIGGMAGIIDEWKMLGNLQPNAAIVPIASAGGASLLVAESIENCARDLFDDLDYVSLFHRYVGVSVKERRFKTPAEQPASLEERFWTK